MNADMKGDLEERYFKLLDQIVKGADFISNIDGSHNQWAAANEKYDRLCSDALQLRGMIK